MIEWGNRQDPSGLHMTAISVAEMLAGVSVLPNGKRKDALKISVEETISRLINPILPFNESSAATYASLYAQAKANLYTLPFGDAQIAAIAAVHGFAVATRDVEPFLAAGVPVINPWEE